MKKALSLIFMLVLNSFAFAQDQNWFSDIHICETNDTTIAFPSNAYSDSTFSWFFETTLLQNNTDMSVTVSQEGLYVLQIINSGQDTISDSLNLYIDFEAYDFVVDVNSEQSIDSVVRMCMEDNPTLVSSQSDLIHFWYLDGFALDDSLAEFSLTIEDILDEIEFEQEYIFTASVENSCGIVEAKNEVTLVVNECKCELNMPNVFSPNGDEFNNTFKPFNDHEDLQESDYENMCKSTDYKMEVFSQWGRHIATVNSGNDYPSWDGLNKKGNEVSEGVYFYRIVYKVNVYSEPEEKETTGFVHLYRD
tara:strand:- start:138 stop:1055 length:918 start_codon:yes stop_codon:yes gene_type:complete